MNESQAIATNREPRCCTYIPNYNYHSKGFLTQCLDSVIKQTYPNLQILVIDDGSTDGSQEVISEYASHDPRITFIAQPHRGIRWGQGWINMAFKWATDHDIEFFGVLGSDDMYADYFWESVLPYFSTPEIGFVRVGLWSLREEDQGNAKWIRPKEWKHMADIIADNKVFNSSPFRMAMQRNVGEWDDNISWSDWDFWARAVVRYGWKWSTCKEPLFYYRKHSSQLAAGSRADYQEHLINYMTEKYKDDLTNIGVVHRFGRKVEESHD